MVNINPSADELFYLRMLLKCTPGATSHSDLRTIDGVTHPTYKAACQALNLVENDSQWEECLREAEMISVPRAIRDLFCTIIFDCHPTDPARLFEMFADTMSEDFEHKRSKDPRYCTAITKQLARNDLLCALNENLKVHNQTNDHYGIPMPDESLQKLDNDDEFDPHASEFFAQNMPLLNEEQRELLDTLKRCVDSRKSGCYGLDAPAGCGKKFLNNVLLAYVRQEQNIAIATAMSGIASILLTLGTTFHKRFKPPIKFFKGSTSNIEMDSEEAEVIRKAALILIDEVSMMHRDLLDMLDGLLRTLMDRDEPMGGKLVILLYDFRQLLPVIPREGRAGIVAASVKNSKVWPHFTELKLTRNMRVERLIKENPTPERTKALRDYSEWLLQIGNGTAPTIDAGSHDIVEIPQQMVCLSPEELEAKVYDDFDIHYTDPQYLHKRAILACKNDVIQECNSKLVAQLPGEEFVSDSIDECVEDKDKAIHDSDFLNRINASGIPPHHLVLKKNACIILMRSLNPRKGFCNGTRCIINSITNNLIQASSLDGNHEEILIPRIPMISEDTSFPVPFKRRQYPVLLAYYLTFNRAEGQSLDTIGLLLPQSVFSHGHLYVGFSRCGDPNKVFVYANQEEFENLRQHLRPDRTYTRNIVWPEVFEP